MKKLFTLSLNLLRSLKPKAFTMFMVLSTISYGQVFAQEWQMIGGIEANASVTYCSSMEVSAHTIFLGTKQKAYTI